MSKTLASALALVALAALPALAEELADLKSPLMDAQPGEWVEYKMTYSAPMMGPPQEIPHKVTVVAVQDSKVTIKSELELMGMPQESTTEVDASQSILDSISNVAGPMGGQLQNMKVLSSSVQDEDYEFQGTTHKAKKVTVELTAEFSFGGAGGAGMPVKAQLTMWLSYDIPVHGALKNETKVQIDMGGQPMELTATSQLARCGTSASEEDGGFEEEDSGMGSGKNPR